MVRLLWGQLRAGARGGGRAPDRKLSVLFLGAGASKAAGLPLTEEPRTVPAKLASHECWDQTPRHWSQASRSVSVRGSRPGAMTGVFGALRMPRALGQ